MEIVFRVCLFVAGVINFLPSVLAYFPNKISNSYGIEIPDANYELILRHRAILFGIVGGLMIYSAVAKKNYTIAFLIGLISMVSFVVLYLTVDGVINPELTKIMKIDIAGIIILMIGFVTFKLKRQH